MQNDVRTELGTNFIEYAVAVNTDRAIPDAKSGLKPVAKRILWSAYEEGRVFSKPHVKAARIVGDVMGKYHPHGDSSIYGAMVRLSQPWIMRYPLVDWHGSNGNQSGDGPAAMRYTEARLSKLSEDGMLAGIKKKNVDFIPNFDETLDEPVTLPAIFPNLLCNPNTGIGVAMACNWLPHNLNEVAEAINMYIKGEEPTLPGPDFPTGGTIVNSKDIPAIMRTGHGSIKVRGKYKVEKNNIVFYEIPYGTIIGSNGEKKGLLDEIAEVCNSKEIEGIVEIRDETNKKGIRIVIECAKNVNPDIIANKLYSKTNLQTSISYNQVALIDKTPTELNLKDCCRIYLEHNLECLIKELTFDLNKAKARLHIVEGLLICLEDIDNVIALIKKSENSAAAKIALIEKYNLSEEQAKSVLAMRLSSLAHMEKIELENEKKELVDYIEELEDILAKKPKQIKMIQLRLADIVKKYGDARRTELLNIEIPKEEKEIVEVIPEDCVVIMTKTGNIKRVPTSAFKTQRRNGKGVKTENDVIMDTISTNTIDELMLFTNFGKMYKILVDKIPSERNINVKELIKLEGKEDVIAITSLYRKSKAKYVVFFTKNGLIKKTPIEEYRNAKRSSGILAIKLKEADSIVGVSFIEDEEIMVFSNSGNVIRFTSSDITPVGRNASGVKAIKLINEEVLKGIPIHKTTDKVALFSATGTAKKVDLSEFPLQGRGGKGVRTYTENLVGVELIEDSDNILISGKPNSICISAKDIPSTSRNAIGNIMIKGSKIEKVVKI